MKMNEAKNELKFRAAEALKSVLAEVSAIKLKELRCQPAVSGGEIGIVVRIEVLGHSHSLACEVQADGQPHLLPSILRRLQNCTSDLQAGATPVIIAPYLSPEAQAVCKQSNASFLDLAGNARITVGEVFIGKRTLSSRNSERRFEFVAPALDMVAKSKLSQQRTDSLHSARSVRTYESSLPAVAMV